MGLLPARLPAEAITPWGTRGPLAAAWRPTWLPHRPRPGESLRAAVSDLEAACVLAEEAEQREPAGNGEKERVYRGGLSGPLLSSEGGSGYPHPPSHTPRYSSALSSPTSPCSSPPATLDFLPFSEPARTLPASGPLHWLLPRAIMLSPHPPGTLMT